MFANWWKNTFLMTGIGGIADDATMSSSSSSSTTTTTTTKKRLSHKRSLSNISTSSTLSTNSGLSSNEEPIVEVEEFISSPTSDARYQVMKNLCGHTRHQVRLDVVQSPQLGQTLVDKQTELHADGRTAEMAMRELEIMLLLQRNGLKHEHLVHLEHSFTQEERLHLMLEYCPQGDLMGLLMDLEQQGQTLNEATIREYIRQICHGLSFMHQRGVAHLDLSLENVFLTKEGSLKLGDFGLSRHVTSANLREKPYSIGKTFYAAPEVYFGGKIDLLKADSWSLGIVLLMLLTMRTPMREATMENTQYRVLKHRGLLEFLRATGLGNKMCCGLTKELFDLIDKLLNPDPSKRLSIRQVLDHPWMNMS